MWTPLFLLVLLPLFAASGDIDYLTYIARSFFHEDFFHAHLKSDFVNASISPCDNFYRRICPTNFPFDSMIWFKVAIKIRGISEMFASVPSMRPNTMIQEILASSGPDQTDYASVSSIAKAVDKIPFDKLKNLLTSSFIGGGDHNDLVRQKFESNKTIIVKAIAYGIHSFMHKLELGIYKNSSKFKYYNEKIRKFEGILHSERAMLALAQRLNYTAARERTETVISNIIDEYQSSIKMAPWSSKEDRFGYSRRHLLATYIGNVSHTIAFANRFSIPDTVKEAISEKYIDTFVLMHKYVFDGFSGMPTLRVLCSKLYAIYSALGGYPDAYKEKYENEPFLFEAEAGELRIAINQVITLDSSFSAKLASLIGYTGYLFAHEMYHVVRRAHRDDYGIIEELSEHENANNCVIAHMDRVCSRFVEKACASGNVSISEDAPDVYGVQIAFRVLQKMLGNEIDEIAFPDLNMTHRELFYHTIAVGWCSNNAQWSHETRDVHNGVLYRTNGMLGQLPDFKETFGCRDEDRMAFPEESMCPAFSDELSRRRRK